MSEAAQQPTRDDLPTDPQPGDVLIRFEDVHKSFGPKYVHRGIDLTIYKGESLTILGGSGQGKSVLLKELIGLMKPDRGHVWFRGRDLVGRSEDELQEARRHISMLFQGGALFDFLTVGENVAYPLREQFDLPDDEIREIVADKLRVVGLEGTADLYPQDLSGGMQKRAALARAIATTPDVILYDEPTTGLDPTNVTNINSLIRTLQREQGVTSIAITHDLESAFAISDRLALMYDGRILAVGPVDEMRHSDNEKVRAFIEGTMAELVEGIRPEPEREAEERG